ncbi:MAG: ATP-binding protein [Ktedonobacteraceae bacterium]|nr:ATP-binding protein [Ktedonobacteraceae bacterium]
MSNQHRQEMHWDEDAQEWYTYEPQAPSTNHSGKSAIYIIGYFLLLAVLMFPAQKMHVGMQGVFFAMVGAGLLLAASILLYKFIRHKVEQMHLTGKGFFQVMVGYQPEIVQDEDEQDDGGQGAAVPAVSQGRSPLPATSTAIQPYHEESELPDAIIEDNPMHLSDTFQPDVNGALGATILLCGRRRSGKSNAIGVLIEELARYYTPLCLGDTEDEYSALVANRDYLPRGVMAGSSELATEARAAGIRYMPIDREGAYDFGQSIPRDVLQVVLNLQSFADDDEAAVIMSEIIAGMNDWEQSRPNDKRVPCTFALDEANKWLPQNITESCIQDREVLYTLQRAIFGTMVRRGGKRGLGLILTTQRIAELDKRAMQSIWKFLFAQGEEVDLDRYAALGLDRNEVLELRQGECFIFSPGVIGFKTMMRKRHSTHLGHTPGLSQLAAHLQRLAPLAVVTARTYTSVDGAIHGEAAPEQGNARQKAKTELERALEAWNAGATSGRKLAAALNVTEGAGNRLMNALKAKGLVVEAKTREQQATGDE